MAQLLVHHKVQDYAAWRKVYDELGRTRARFGSTGDRVYRTANDPNEVVIITEWPDIDQARAYAQSPDLKEGMQRAGVISQPEVLFLEDA